MRRIFLIPCRRKAELTTRRRRWAPRRRHFLEMRKEWRREMKKKVEDWLWEAWWWLTSPWWFTWGFVLWVRGAREEARKIRYETGMDPEEWERSWER